MVTLKDSFFVY